MEEIMKRNITPKILAFVAFSPFTTCIANEVPTNSLQVEYKKQKRESKERFNISNFYRIPVATYQYLDTVFTSFYNKVTFKTTITDSTFKNNAHYELVALPLIAENKEGLQLELFGNFSSSSTPSFSNFSADQALYDYYSNTAQNDDYNGSFSVGAGFSFKAGERSKIKVVISNNDMPGYGASTALLGFQTRF